MRRSTCFSLVTGGKQADARASPTRFDLAKLLPLRSLRGNVQGKGAAPEQAANRTITGSVSLCNREITGEPERAGSCRGKDRTAIHSTQNGPKPRSTGLFAIGRGSDPDRRARRQGKDNQNGVAGRVSSPKRRRLPITLRMGRLRGGTGGQRIAPSDCRRRAQANVRTLLPFPEAFVHCSDDLRLRSGTPMWRVFARDHSNCP